jgi:predicted Fe-S protein YdhL (DUF1289 family)
MINHVDFQGSKDGQQDSPSKDQCYQDSPSKERGVCCAGGLCVAKSQLLDRDIICIGCFKIVHKQCDWDLDKDGNTICAACGTKPEGSSGNSSGTVTDTSDNKPPRQVLWIMMTPVRSPTQISWSRSVTAASPTSTAGTSLALPAATSPVVATSYTATMARADTCIIIIANVIATAGGTTTQPSDDSSSEESSVGTISKPLAPSASPKTGGNHHERHHDSRCCGSRMHNNTSS